MAHSLRVHARDAIGGMACYRAGIVPCDGTPVLVACGSALAELSQLGLSRRSSCISFSPRCRATFFLDFLSFATASSIRLICSSPHALGFSALEDQQCAGALMWTCVTVVYLVAGTIVAARLLSPESVRAVSGRAIRFASQFYPQATPAEYGGRLNVRQTSSTSHSLRPQRRAVVSPHAACFPITGR